MTFYQKYLFIYLFVFGCAGSVAAQAFSPVAVSGDYSLAAVSGLFVAVALLMQSMSSRAHRLHSCGFQALELRLNSCGARA